MKTETKPTARATSDGRTVVDATELQKTSGFKRFIAEVSKKRKRVSRRLATASSH